MPRTYKTSVFPQKNTRDNFSEKHSIVIIEQPEY